MIMKRALLDLNPTANIISIPIADGGEGSLEAFFQAMKTRGHDFKYIRTKSVNPYLEKIEANYISNSKLAIIESAESIGISLVKSRKNPLLTSSYGLGLIIKDAVNSGVNEILLALGGSSTNDCGAGMAAALGYEFINSKGKSFIPTGGTLKDVARINFDKVDSRLFSVKFTAICDCKNPLLGENGASFVYAKQKGATENDIVFLEDNMKSFSNLLRPLYGSQFLSIEGGGAAGGIGVGATLFLKAQLKSGIETLLDLVNFENIIKDANFIVSGEGRFDHQSFMGKAISGIAKRAKNQNVPLYVLAGQSNVNQAPIEYGIHGVFVTNTENISVAEKIAKSRQDIYSTTQKIYRDYLSKNS